MLEIKNITITPNIVKTRQQFIATVEVQADDEPIINLATMICDAGVYTTGGKTYYSDCLPMDNNTRAYFRSQGCPGAGQYTKMPNITYWKNVNVNKRYFILTFNLGWEAACGDIFLGFSKDIAKDVFKGASLNDRNVGFVLNGSAWPQTNKTTSLNGSNSVRTGIDASNIWRVVFDNQSKTIKLMLGSIVKQNGFFSGDLLTFPYFVQQGQPLAGNGSAFNNVNGNVRSLVWADSY